jgi:SAM-dependent methyltransferase
MSQAPPQSGAFDEWAAFYDVSDGDRTPFVRFYTGLVSDRTRSLLEIGCGTGTVTIPVAQEIRRRAVDGERIRIAGVDASRPMLHEARKRRSDIAWIQGDMRDVPLCPGFDLIVCCFNTLQMLLSDSDLERAFAEVHRLLAPGGVFAFDIYQPNLEYLHRGATDRMARAFVDHDGRQLEIREDARYDPSTGVLALDWRLVGAGRSDAPPLATAQFDLRQYFPADVDRLLARSGLVVRQRFGEFDLAPPTATARKQIVICERSSHG